MREQRVFDALSSSRLLTRSKTHLKLSGNATWAFAMWQMGSILMRRQCNHVNTTHGLMGEFPNSQLRPPLTPNVGGFLSFLKPERRCSTVSPCVRCRPRTALAPPRPHPLMPFTPPTGLSQRGGIGELKGAKRVNPAQPYQHTILGRLQQSE